MLQTVLEFFKNIFKNKVISNNCLNLLWVIVTPINHS